MSESRDERIRRVQEIATNLIEGQGYPLLIKPLGPRDSCLSVEELIKAAEGEISLLDRNHLEWCSFCREIFETLEKVAPTSHPDFLQQLVTQAST